MMALIYMLKKFLLSLFCVLYAFNSHGKDIKIITTIKPIESLIANIIDDTDTVSAMIDGNYSHHNFALKPSQIRKIYQSDAVILINPNFETFMRSSYKIIPHNTAIITLSDTPDMSFLEIAKNNQHTKHNVTDFHIWLSPDNAIQIVKYLTKKLSTLNPDKQAIYQENSKHMIAKLSALHKQLLVKTEPIKHKSFMAFHNAYQYFIKAYDLNYAGAITHNPMAYTSVKKIKRAQKKLADNNVHCVFKEPQFSDTMIETIIQENRTKIGILDPLGGNSPAGKAHYFQLMHAIGDNLQECLGNN
ncbi:MAG: zinc transport system substrate-binding protein [Alphaproteobacteria bacterium]|jgi:zinc transport system substrate-binding protein